MSSYRDLIEFIAHRQIALLGRSNTYRVFGEAGLELDDDLALRDSRSYGVEDLEKLASALYDAYGPVAIMGCKIPVKRKARQENLKLPDILS
ncbi:MAG: hypothetical protein ACNS63_12585 [Candidatus Nitrospinota bacterium M3_3B_026]